MAKPVAGHMIESYLNDKFRAQRFPFATRSTGTMPSPSVGPAGLSACGLTTPTFRTVSEQTPGPEICIRRPLSNFEVNCFTEMTCQADCTAS
jgi:hypothetical protein